jgi:AbrB family looped-hinge helix DNA binding protein
MSYKVTKRGQITLPRWVREAIGVAPGGEAGFRINDRGEVVLEKAGGARRQNPFSRWRGFLGPRPSTDEVMAMTRGDPADDALQP